MKLDFINQFNDRDDSVSGSGSKGNDKFLTQKHRLKIRMSFIFSCFDSKI